MATRISTLVSNFVPDRTLQLGGEAAQFIKQNLGIVGLGIGSVLIATGVGSIAASRIGGTRRKKVSKRKKSTTRRRLRTRKSSVKRKRRGRFTPHTAGKGKDTSTRRIRYTTKGQPYVILRSGKARFIKKTSARRSHKLPGGRY